MEYRKQKSDNFYIGISPALPHGDITMNVKLDRITINPEILNGQPCVRGMRLTVRRVVEAVAIYPNREELKKEYPELTDEDIRQSLEFAAQNLDDEVIARGAA